MAFPQPNVQRELANRKILEELQLKKQLLLKQGVPATPNTNNLTTSLGPSLITTGASIQTGPVTPAETHSLTSAQRAALHSAHTQSAGYFITQDSSFEEHLQDIEVFKRPKVLLEQYPTPPHLGSHMLHVMQSVYGDISEKLVGDLGCGCGSLTIGAALLNASHVIGFDIDHNALEILLDNLENQDISNVDVIHTDVLDIPERFSNLFDTIIMNPPFGTKQNVGIDMKFLKTAFKLTNNTVYSLHKTSTRAHVLKTAKSCEVDAEVLAELRYDLPATYRFHKKSVVDIEVDFYRFTI